MPVSVVTLTPALKAHRTRVGRPRLIIVHHSDTRTPLATRAALTRAGLSTHYEVGPDGTIYEYLDPARDVAYHAGTANGASIGIDLTHRSKAPWPEAQIKAAAALVQMLCGDFDIPLKVAPDKAVKSAEAWIRAGVGILRHRNVGATACPEDLPMERLVVAAGGTDEG